MSFFRSPTVSSELFGYRTAGISTVSRLVRRCRKRCVRGETRRRRRRGGHSLALYADWIVGGEQKVSARPRWLNEHELGDSPLLPSRSLAMTSMRALRVSEEGMSVRAEWTEKGGARAESLLCLHPFESLREYTCLSAGGEGQKSTSGGVDSLP
jgi:hypothetical protein